MKQTIWWDMDGTIADLYGVPNWLTYLQAEDSFPYEEAAVMHNMAQLAKLMNKVQQAGYKLGIISWLSKTSTASYDKSVTEAKLGWLSQHLHSVHFDAIHIVAYGTPKATFIETENDILFDDEEKNRADWTGIAYEPNKIITILKQLLKGE